MAEAFQNIETDETTETNDISGRVGFSFAGGTGSFVVSRVTVAFVYTDDRVARWTICFPVEPGALPGMLPLLKTLGTTEDEIFDLPPDEEMQVSFSARADVLARLSPELLPADRLSAMFRAGNQALLDLDNYEPGACQIVTRPVEAASA